MSIYIYITPSTLCLSLWLKLKYLDELEGSGHAKASQEYYQVWYIPTTLDSENLANYIDVVYLALLLLILYIPPTNALRC